MRTMEEKLRNCLRLTDELTAQRDAARAEVEHLKRERDEAKRRADEWEYRAGEWMVRAEDAEAQFAVAMERLARVTGDAP